VFVFQRAPQIQQLPRDYSDIEGHWTGGLVSTHPLPTFHCCKCIHNNLWDCSSIRSCVYRKNQQNSLTTDVDLSNLCNIGPRISVWCVCIHTELASSVDKTKIHNKSAPTCLR
jgi:hypothetical protein